MVGLRGYRLSLRDSSHTWHASSAIVRGFRGRPPLLRPARTSPGDDEVCLGGSPGAASFGSAMSGETGSTRRRGRCHVR
jgi:hypothetical protein